MAASKCRIVALLVVASSCFLAAAAGRVAVFSNSARTGGHEEGSAIHGRRNLLEPEQEKSAQVDHGAVAWSIPLERRLEDIHEEKLHGEVSTEIAYELVRNFRMNRISNF
jgi:hypothetical protein